MGVLWAVGIHLLQWLLAYLALDLLFRVIPLEPERLGEQVRLYRRRFIWLAGGCATAGAVAQVGLAGGWGVVPALLGWVPWWVLWRFGWRKQFTFLFKHDGGRDLHQR